MRRFLLSKSWTVFIKEGPAVLSAIKTHSDADIFLDLKLHDIPATVERAVRSAAAHNVRFLTVHCAGGEAMLKAAVNGAGKSGLQILGVTVLTSLGPDDHREELGYRKDLTVKDLVVTRAGMAENAGCAGVVCSGEELTRIHEHIANVMTVVPGIRPADNAVRNDDQKRAMTPKQAIQAGADYLVVGRPIRDAADPKAAAQRIVQEISEALPKAK
jgi:orotidine-5'-phosphate decarboxylase